MINKFLELSENEALLMYMSEGYCNNSGQGDRGVIGNMYSIEEIRRTIREWEEEVLSDIRETSISIDDAYSENGISLTKLVYSKDGEILDIIDDTKENKALLEEIRDKCEDNIDNYEIEDIVYYHARVEISDNEINLNIIHDACYQTVSKYITIKKVNKSDVRYCVVIERPVNSRECGQYILAGPYINLDEAKSLVGEFSSERDLYGTVRNPYVIATYTTDKWLKNHYKKNGISK